MRFLPVKCIMMQLTGKQIEKINVEDVDKIKYLGVTITEDLRWNTHVKNSK